MYLTLTSLGHDLYNGFETMLLLIYISSFSGKCAVTDYYMIGLGIILAWYLLSRTILSRKLCTNEYYKRGLLN